MDISWPRETRNVGGLICCVVRVCRVTLLFAAACGYVGVSGYVIVCGRLQQLVVVTNVGVC